MIKGRIFNKLAQLPTFPCDPFGGEFNSETGEVINGTYTVYTVPVDKVLYITDWNMHINIGSSPGIGYGMVTDSASTIRYYFFLARGSNKNCFMGYSLSTPYVIPNGWMIKVYSGSANMITRLTYHGWLFDTV